ncbi:MAG: hypothetical protein Q7V01_12145 [Vicinamibacterales bacterium]|nr:hypothetical protein [Vicinamibacterales bacterium]
MIRTQIQLTEQQARQLRTQAQEARVSLAEIIRRCIDRALAEAAPARASRYDRAARTVGRFPDRRSGRDLGRHHDRYLDEAYS